MLDKHFRRLTLLYFSMDHNKKEAMLVKIDINMGRGEVNGLFDSRGL